MGNVFSKFFMSFGFNKKNKYLPSGTNSEASLDIGTASVSINEPMTTAGCNTVKPLASFDINIEKPRYQGAIPEATIKFYPID